MILFEELNVIITTGNWDKLKQIIQPKIFPLNEKGQKIDRKIVALVAGTLVKIDKNPPPDEIVVLLLKCMTNSCIEQGYIHKRIDNKNIIHPSSYYDNFLYNTLDPTDFHEYPYNNFPYDGVITAIIQLLMKIRHDYQVAKMPIDKLEIIRISLRFFCNIMAFSDCIITGDDNFGQMLQFIGALLTVDTISTNIPLLTAICSFVNNILHTSDTHNQDIVDKLIINDTEQYKIIVSGLVNADKLNITPARSALRCLSGKSGTVTRIYDSLASEHRLYLLELIYNCLVTCVYDDKSNNTDDDIDNVLQLPEITVIFLSERFKRLSDLILKTEAFYLEKLDEPTEVIVLLDILGVLTSTRSEKYKLLREDKSLLINTVFLLRAVHMAGKEKNNCFTPIQKLSEIAPSAYESTNSTMEHVNQVTFGFKTALIRLIGNLMYENKDNQDTVRDCDGISLLLDCCNIDARNPLITQWCILAVRNLTEGNLENQEFIRNSEKIQFIDSAIIREMGLTLNQNEKGEILGIVPLSLDK